MTNGQWALNSRSPMDAVTLDRLDVYKSGELAAELVRFDTHVEFRYRPEYIERGQPAVALSLRVRDTTVATAGRAVPPFFAGLLPEGRRLTALRAAIKTSADDDFSMLAVIGDDATGDVQVVPSGDSPTPAGSSAPDAVELGDTSFRELFAAATGSRLDRTGIAGVQDKVSGRMISIPVKLGGANTIVKLNPPEFPFVVENETFFLQMAHECGLKTVSSSMVTDRDGINGLVVRRFDRAVDAAGITQRIACEDGCQIVGRYPADKYALDTATLFAAVATECQAPIVAARNMLQQLAFATITGNGDLHAKNVSLLRKGSEWMVAPAYDVPSTVLYEDRSLALAIESTRSWQVSRKRFIALGEQLGLRPKATATMLDDLIARTEPWLDRLDELPFDTNALRRLRRHMTSALRLLRPTDS
jgi:serine/threonine-protein kinase HipA